MTPEQIAVALLQVAVKCWPLLRDIIEHSKHPEARRVVDVLPLTGESARVAAELSEIP